ncbi:MAG: epoxyqueuosine reductase QueH [Lachnospiraceae bacterium]|nr:epoxyqueuosine reductase QueH [Lachnospiraceae bacterium]
MNEQKLLDRILSELNDKRQKAEAAGDPYDPPRLFLHSCCAPCSSYCLQYMADYFAVTDFYYNPNITEKPEFVKRSRELERLISEMPLHYPVTYVEGPYEPKRFFEAVKGFEDVPEGGERCFICYEMRLRESARLAAEGSYDYFTTTLTISPLKNSAKLNEIGRRLEAEYGVKWLPSDFKKKNGYLTSIELSKQYELYRQNYCGCVFSRREAEAREQAKTDE